MKGRFFGKNGIGKLLRGYRRHIALMSLLTVAEALAQVTMALLTRFVIDAALSRSENLLCWSIALGVDVLLLVVMHAGLSWYTGTTADRFSAGLRKSILRSAAYSTDSKLQGYHSGELLNRGLEDVNILCDGAMNALPSLVGQVTRLVASLVAVVAIHPPLVVALLLAAAAVGAFAAGLRPVLRRQHRRVRESDEKVMSNMQESLQQLELIQSLEVQEPILVGFGKRLKRNLKMRAKRRRWSVGISSVIHGISQIGSAALLLWGVLRVSAGAISYGSLTSMLQLLSLFRSPVLGLSGLWTRLAAVDVAAERLDLLLEEQPPREKTALPGEILGVVFENVTFTYPGDEIPVLQNFSVRFPLSGWACLTGISGKGKSTLFKLILGLYKPQEGRVYLETTAGEVLCSADTRAAFAYVPQDYAMFSGTVLENFQLVDPVVDDEKMRKVLSVAQAEFLMELNGRELTPVGENNTGLSKGQLQRLAIARAILMERPVFLLDECTSALDAETEEAVLRGLKALGKRAILVTHRPDALTDIPGITSISMDA